MLNIEATNDKELLDTLSIDIFGAAFDGGVGYVLNCDKKPIGIAKVNISQENAIVKSVGILPSERGNGYGDFFTRVLLNNLTMVIPQVYIGYQSSYFNKFGFTTVGDTMVINSCDIVFPSVCKHSN